MLKNKTAETKTNVVELIESFADTNQKSNNNY